MVFNNWPHAAPLPPSPPQYCTPGQMVSGYDQAQFGGAPNNPSAFYSAYGSGAAYNHFPHELPNNSQQNAYSTSNMSNMNSMALVEALLAPSVNQRTTRSPRRVRPTTPTRPRRTQNLSSPLSRFGSHNYSSEIDRHDDTANNTRKTRGSKRKPSVLPTPATGPAKHTSKEVSTHTAISPNPRRSKRVKLSSVPSQHSPAADAKEGLPEPEPVTSKKASRPPRPLKVNNKRLVRKKPQGTKVPETLADAGEADKMMWAWKNGGKDWEDIRNEWARITGIKPGKSSLSVRYIKLNENFARHGAAGDLELMRFRKEAEEELMANLWNRVAEKMLAFNPLSEHNPKDLAKRYDLLVRSGFDVQQLHENDLANQQKAESEVKDDDAVFDAAVGKVERTPGPQPSELPCTTYPSPYGDMPPVADPALLPFSHAFSSNAHVSFSEINTDTFANTTFPRLNFPESNIYRGATTGGQRGTPSLDPPLTQVDGLSADLDIDSAPGSGSGNARLVAYTTESD